MSLEPASAERQVMFVAGENSGDLHASKVIRELRALMPNAKVFGYGGERMEAAGMELFENLAQRLPIMGFTQVAANYGKLRALFARAVGHLESRKPDLLVLVDYPGFNLRLAREAAKRGVRIVYYISPQLWAWHHSRIKIIRDCVALMLVILPFEKTMYDEAGVACTYVGHPLLDDAEAVAPRKDTLDKLGLDETRLVVGLLPGSRIGEIGRHMPALLEACRAIQQDIPGVQWVLPRAGTIARERLQPWLDQYADVKVVVAESDLKSVRASLDFAICKSGTATLELAMFAVPMVIFYKVSAFTAFIARRVLRIPHVGLVNIVAQKEVAPELLQQDASPQTIAARVTALLRDPQALERMREDMRQVKEKLGGPGASRRAANEIAAMLRR